MDMVERVARALADEARFMYERDPERWTDAAIAAIKAMREPTPEMALSGYGKITLRIERDETDLYEAWRAMIDAALATQEG